MMLQAHESRLQSTMRGLSPLVCGSVAPDYRSHTDLTSTEISVNWTKLTLAKIISPSIRTDDNRIF